MAVEQSQQMEAGSFQLKHLDHPEGWGGGGEVGGAIAGLKDRMTETAEMTEKGLDSGGNVEVTESMEAEKAAKLPEFPIEGEVRGKGSSSLNSHQSFIKWSCQLLSSQEERATNFMEPPLKPTGSE